MNTSSIHIQTPLADSVCRSLRAGDIVKLSGMIYTARDAAHKRFIDRLNKNEQLPVDLRNQIIYYTGPTPAPPGMVCGSAGPTTSSRMDTYTPALIAATGLKAMIGKGNRSRAVVDAIKQYGCVYFAATGGAGAMIGRSIKSMEAICYDDLGPEAVYKMEVFQLQLFVAIDSLGNNLYESGPSEFRKDLP